MYQINSFVRILNFVSRTLVGIVAGYFLAQLFPPSSLIALLENLK